MLPVCVPPLIKFEEKGHRKKKTPLNHIMNIRDEEDLEAAGVLVSVEETLANRREALRPLARVSERQYY